VAPVYVWWARRQDSSPRLEALLDDVGRGRRDSYRRAEDRDRFLVGNALVKCAVAARTGKPPAGVVIDRTCPHCGKPHGKTVVPGLELSVTHSGDLVGVAVHDAYPVGVDVEQIRQTHDRDALRRYVMSETETGDLFTAWTRKEAVTKATGDGLGVSFKKIVLTAEGADPPGVLSWPYPASPQSVTLFDLEPGPDYVAALAVLGPCDSVVAQDGTALLADHVGHL
jgi:4'-phosphopantetheinyl transferase